MTTTRPIAVFGASGAQGGPVVQALLDNHRAVRAVARSEGGLRRLEAAGAEAVAVDLADRAALESALAGVDGAFVHLPFVPVVEVVRAWATALGEALVTARVPLAVYSSSGPVPTQPTGVASIDTKSVAQDILRGSGAPIVFLTPTTYLGNLSAPFSARSVVEAGELRYPPVPSDQRLAWISVEDQARLTLAALRRADLAGRTLPIGQRLTAAELADAIAPALGRRIRHAPATPKQFGALVAAMMGEQAGQALAGFYAVLAAAPASLGLDADTDASHRELGVTPTPVADWARTQDWKGAAALATPL